MLLVDQDFLPQATAMIDMAHHHIDITTFKAEVCPKPAGCRLRVFFDKLFEKQAKGVRIRFLINWHNGRRPAPLTNAIVIRELKEHNIDVRKLPNDRCCHAKILLIDRRRAIVGSHNLSIRSCHYNFEMSYILSDPVSINRLSDVFTHTFQNSQKL